MSSLFLFCVEHLFPPLVTFRIFLFITGFQHFVVVFYKIVFYLLVRFVVPKELAHPYIGSPSLRHI